jgi:NADH-quinone oxidoreductase subunit G
MTHKTGEAVPRVEGTLTLDGRKVRFCDERNVLEVARKAGIDIPTFCYHSELSVYGACRLCLVDIEGRGIVTSCSTRPEKGMVIRTNTREIRDIRRINVELLLASHERECTSCGKSGLCSLQSLARKMGIEDIRYQSTRREAEVDRSSPCLVHNPNKCILCGDCVRFCDEIQGIGAIDFSFRGAQAKVGPAFDKHLADVECVGCGQCSRVCPTGALLPRSEIQEVWQKLDDPGRTVVVQIAPAIRTALGEHFGIEASALTTGRIVTALKALGFDQVYDTSFTADMTVLEESHEFLARQQKGEKLPLFTSCCPAWVKFAEQYYPELLGNISTCRSPQQMFGSLAKAMLPEMLKVEAEKLTVVSIMPCTAKKFEAKRPEFCEGEHGPDVDHVITTSELAQMIEQAGIDFRGLPQTPFDLPMGFKTGAGMIFGASGGVTEAVLRYAVTELNGQAFDADDFREAREMNGVREITTVLGGKEVRFAIVYGLANARTICEQAKAKTCVYDFVEVMACPGGCINGAGQPVSYNWETIKKRGQSLYEADASLQLHKPQDNPYLARAYMAVLDEIGGPKAHAMLHTRYESRKRRVGAGLSLLTGDADAVNVEVCMGTNCYLHGSHDLLRGLMRHVEQQGLSNRIQVKTAFCFENCGQSPNVRIGDTLVSAATLEKAVRQLDQELQK